MQRFPTQLEWRQPKPALYVNAISLPAFRFIMLLANGMGYNSLVIWNSISSTWITFVKVNMATSAALKQENKTKQIKQTKKKTTGYITLQSYSR